MVEGSPYERKNISLVRYLRQIGVGHISYRMCLWLAAARCQLRCPDSGQKELL